jgi:hypothetical protein
MLLQKPVTVVEAVKEVSKEPTPKPIVAESVKTSLIYRRHS